MSYNIQLYRIETKEQYQKLREKNFFDNEQNLAQFTDEQFKALRKRLLIYDYIEEQDKGNSIEFKHSEYNIRALLTQRGLYFSAAGDRKTIFEASLTASEFTDSDEFAKYDPQHGGWEEI